MDFAEGYPKYMPSPYSVYVSNFTEQTLEALKKSAPFARYHKDRKEYEVTPEVFEELCQYEEAHRIEGTKSYIPGKDKFVIAHPEIQFSYQDDVVEYAKTHSHILIAFSQGMGKSLSALRILNELGSKRSLIVTGVSNLQEEWLKDARKHHATTGKDYVETLNLSIVGDTPDSSLARRIKWLKQQTGEQFTHLIGIESLRNSNLVEACNSLHYDTIVVDEVQSAKGLQADQTQGLQDLECYEGQRRIALSGTPVINDPLEYYSLLRFLGVLYYRNRIDQCARTTFEKYYGVWGFDYLGHTVIQGYQRLDKLNQLIEPIICAAPKSLLDIPPKIREVVELQEPEGLEQLIKIRKKGTAGAKKAGYSSIHTLDAEIQILTSTAPSKIEFISHQPRSLVFSRYTKVLNKVKEELELKGKVVLYYHGKLNMQDRLEILKQWKSGVGDILLLSINCARYGLNLQEVQTTIFLEPPTAFAILEQAEDRAHRIGQTKEVHSYILLTGKSDEKDWKKLEMKQLSLTHLKEA